MVNWTAEKDQIILKGIFKFHDIKSSAPLLKYLVQQIGEDCTPKAVSHRLTNIRNHGKPLVNGNASTPGKAVGTPKTPRTPKTPKTPGSRAKATPKKSNIDTTSESENDGPEGLLDSPSVKRAASQRAKSTPKRSYTEADTDSEHEEGGEKSKPLKKVKLEPMDDEEGHLGFGLRGLDDEYVAEV